jgi:hypothetical protein
MVFRNFWQIPAIAQYLDIPFCGMITLTRRKGTLKNACKIKELTSLYFCARFLPKINTS